MKRVMESVRKRRRHSLDDSSSSSSSEDEFEVRRGVETEGCFWCTECNVENCMNCEIYQESSDSLDDSRFFPASPDSLRERSSEKDFLGSVCTPLDANPVGTQKQKIIIEHSPRSMAGSSSTGTTTTSSSSGSNTYRPGTSKHILRESPFPVYTDTGVQAITDIIRDKLIRNNEMDRLNEYLDSRLSECGWKLDIRNILKVAVQNGKSPKLEHLYDLVRERGKMLVPRQIRREMIEKIIASYTIEIEGSDASPCAGSDRSA